jgi:hypothetical protein
MADGDIDITRFLEHDSKFAAIHFQFSLSAVPDPTKNAVQQVPKDRESILLQHSCRSQYIPSRQARSSRHDVSPNTLRYALGLFQRTPIGTWLCSQPLEIIHFLPLVRDLSIIVFEVGLWQRRKPHGGTVFDDWSASGVQVHVGGFAFVHAELPACDYYH